VPALALALSWGSPGTPGGWQEQRYAGRTVYTPRTSGGDTTMRAIARGTNSALIHAIGLDPRGVTLEWRWRVFAHPKGADPEARSKDDRAAGLLVLVRRGLFPWSWRAPLYQWSESPPAEVWSHSPYSRNVKTLTLRTGPADSTWRTERRDLAADLRQAFGEVPETIEAIGVICDADNTGSLAAAEFGLIRWSRTDSSATTSHPEPQD
jgi:hypothetical protein